MNRLERVREALRLGGYIFVTLWDAGAQRGEHHKQVEKHVHPQTGRIFIVEPMRDGGVEVYENTEGNDLSVALDRITQGAKGR